MIVALGTNDAYYDVPAAEVKTNLEAIIGRVQARGARVVLAGAGALADEDPAYREDVGRLYRDVARAHRLPLIPSLLTGIDMVPSLTLADRVHPTAKGAAIVAGTVYRVLEPPLPARPRDRGASTESAPASTG